MNTPTQSLSQDDGSLNIQWLPRVHSLVVAVDLTSDYGSIIQSAAEFIKDQPEASLTLLHVIPEEYLLVGDFGVVTNPTMVTRRTSAIAELEKLKTSFPAGTCIESLVIEGRSATEICRVAKEVKADFILMASHGRTGIKRVMMGSTAEEVVHNAHCSVLILKQIEGKTAWPHKIERLAVAFDESESSRAALALGLKFMRHSVKHLNLIRAVEPITLIAPEMSLISDSQRLQEAQVRLDKVCHDIPGPVMLKAHVRLGKPWRVIQEIAEENRCDLLIIGAHEYWRPGEFILGTTAERVVRHATCPVLVVRPSEPAA